MTGRVHFDQLSPLSKLLVSVYEDVVCSGIRDVQAIDHLRSEFNNYQEKQEIRAFVNEDPIIYSMSGWSFRFQVS